MAYTKFETVTNDGYSLVDNQTGEIKEFKQVKKVSYDDFMIVFLSTIPEMMNLKGNQMKILLLIWKESSFNPTNSTDGNIFYNNKLFKDHIREANLDLTDGAIDVYISQLTKQGFLIKKCKGCYMLNPTYFFKGRVRDAAQMSLTLEFDPKNNNK